MASQVLQVDGANVQLDDRARYGASDSIPTTQFQDVQQPAKSLPSGDINHDIDGLLTEVFDNVLIALDHQFRAQTSHLISLTLRSNGRDFCARALGQLDGGRPDAT